MKLKSPHFDKLKSLTKKQKKLILAGIALFLLILAASYTVFIAPLLQKEQWIYKEETVERGTLKVGVTESGSLEYNTKSIDYNLDLDVSDDDEDDSEEDDDDTVQKYLKIEEIYAASGQRVTEGEELLKFTEDSVEAVRALLQNAVVEAQADYAEAESTYELSLLEAQTDYDTQKISASYAASIRNTSGTSVTNKVASLQVQLEQKQANTASLQEKLTETQEDYQDALEDYEAAKEGYEGAGTDNTVNFMTIQNGYLSARSKYQQAKSALTQAEDALSENESAITDLQNQLAAAQAKAKQKIDKLDTEETYQEAVITGQNAQTTYNATVEDLKETLQEAEETKEKREEQLQAFEDFVGSDGIIYATEDGVITEVSYEAGDRLTTTGALSSYATSDDMRISVDVTQEDIVDLKVGDAVDITFTTYPEDSYTGSILSINTTATSDYSNTVSYTVEISVEGELEQLYGGMTADVIFVTEEKEDVLYVSRKAIVEENGKTYVYRKTALGGRELAEVETGITNGVDIEILSGLEEGDTIYLASKVSSEEEVKSTEETADSGSSSDTAVGSDTEFGMSEDMQMPGGGDMPQGGPGGGNSGNFGGGMPGGPGGQ